IFNFHLKCVSLPGLARYKYDTHPLTLYRFIRREISWCEICETEIYTKSFFYTCKDCSTAVMLNASLGR
ncbi:hypothetical protein EUTSA_v10019837mg, partial [Eutrema salsugineum]